MIARTIAALAAVAALSAVAAAGARADDVTCHARSEAAIAASAPLDRSEEACEVARPGTVRRDAALAELPDEHRAGRR